MSESGRLSRRLFDAIGAQLVLHDQLGAPAPTLGEHEIDRILGAGGFGLVCRAQHRSLRRTVALKLFPLGGETDAGTRDALREARSLARLEHPAIVTVHAVGEDELEAVERLPCAFVQMQFVDGSTLCDWVDEDRGAIDVLEILRCSTHSPTRASRRSAWLISCGTSCRPRGAATARRGRTPTRG